MTDYTDHPDAIFDPDKPILGSTHLEARDNLISVTEGGSGAPRIQADASEGSVAGAVLLYRSGEISLTYAGSPSNRLLSEVGGFFRARTSGEIRVQVVASSRSGNYEYGIRKNGVIVASVTGAANVSADISFVTGDYIDAFGTVAGPSGSITISVDFQTNATRVVGGM